MKNVLITGASGFIGRSLADYLVASGDYKVIGISREAPGIASSLYEHVYMDMKEKGWTQELDYDVDVVIHLAQSEYYREFPEKVDDMLAVNIDASLEILEWCRNRCVSKFIFTSTGNVYSPKESLMKEGDECIPISMYAATKISAEYLAKQYSSYFQVCILRLFGVYGPGQTGMLVPTMIDRVSKGDEVQLASGIGIIMNPVYISDCLEYIRRITGLDGLDSYLVLNIAGPEILSLKDMVLSIGNVLLMQPEIAENDSKPAYLAGDIEKIVELTGYKPEITFETGINMTVSTNHGD